MRHYAIKIKILYAMAVKSVLLSQRSDYPVSTIHDRLLLVIYECNWRSRDNMMSTALNCCPM